MAARMEFVAKGILGTSVDAIASRANVAVPTVYKNFEGKRGLLRALLVAAPRAELPLLEAVRRSRGPDRVRGLARLATRVAEGIGVDLIRVTLAAAATDPLLASVVRRESASRRRDQATVIREIASAGELRNGLAVDTAIDLTWALLGPESYVALVGDRRWSPGQWERALGDALVRTLLIP